MKGILKAHAWFALHCAFLYIIPVLLILILIAARSIFVYDALFMLPDLLYKKY